MLAWGEVERSIRTSWVELRLQSKRNQERWRFAASISLSYSHAALLQARLTLLVVCPVIFTLGLCSWLVPSSDSICFVTFSKFLLMALGDS